MSLIKRNIMAITTCPSMHDHGAGQVRLSYGTTNPLAIRVATTLTARDVTLDVDVEKFVKHELYRETLHMWLAMAPTGSLLELGEISVKVRRSNWGVVTFKLPKIRVTEKYELIPMFMINRLELQKFITDTYVVAPADTEEALLDVDSCIAKILESSR